jgi:hypothetical protein
MLLLNIQSSPRGAKSASIAVTNAFLDAYQALHSDATIDTLNVWEEDLPDFDQEAIGAKYKGVNKEPMDEVETAVWDKIQELAVRFEQADRIVLGVPMWNFAYPYKLKQLIDLGRHKGTSLIRLSVTSPYASRFRERTQWSPRWSAPRVDHQRRTRALRVGDRHDLQRSRPAGGG